MNERRSLHWDELTGYLIDETGKRTIAGRDRNTTISDEATIREHLAEFAAFEEANYERERLRTSRQRHAVFFAVGGLMSIAASLFYIAFNH